MAAVPATQAKTRKDLAEAADTTIEAALKASPFTGLEPLGPVEQAFTRGPAQ
jgi:hypothetical protein